MIGATGRRQDEIRAGWQARRRAVPEVEAQVHRSRYVGRDVEQIVRDLVEISISLTRERKRKDVQARAEQAAEERVLNALVGPGASPPRARASARSCAPATRRQGNRDRGAGRFLRHADVRNPGMPGAQMGAVNIARFSAARRPAAPRRAASPCTIPTPC